MPEEKNNTSSGSLQPGVGNKGITEEKGRVMHGKGSMD